MLSKDEVGVTLNQGLGIDLCPRLGKQRILITRERAAVVALLRSIGAQRNGLRAGTVCVGDIDIVELSVGGLVADGAGGVVAASGGG